MALWMKKIKTLVCFHAFVRFFWGMALSIFFLAFLVLFARFFVFAPGRVDGKSMQPTLVDEDLFFINKFVYLFRSPRRYEIVQLIDPNTRKLIIKRIIGLPGEIIEIKRGKVFIKRDLKEEAIELDESVYLSASVFTSIKAQDRVIRYFVADNQYFVLGDNRAHSGDSRVYGAAPRECIVGKVWFLKKAN